MPCSGTLFSEVKIAYELYDLSTCYYFYSAKILLLENTEQWSIIEKSGTNKGIFYFLNKLFINSKTGTISSSLFNRSVIGQYKIRTAHCYRPLFSPCKWERDDNIPYPESNSLQSVYSLHFVLSSCLMTLSKDNVNILITQCTDLAPLRLHFMRWRFKTVFVKRSARQLDYCLIPDWSSLRITFTNNINFNVFFMEMYDATSKTNHDDDDLYIFESKLKTKYCRLESRSVTLLYLLWKRKEKTFPPLRIAWHALPSVTTFLICLAFSPLLRPPNNPGGGHSLI